MLRPAAVLRSAAKWASCTADQIRNGWNLLPKQDWDGIQVVFIVSTGRTGMKFFAEYFRDLPAVFGCHEPRPDLLQLALSFAQKRVSMGEAVSAIEQGRRFICREVRRSGATTYVESNNGLFSLIRPLRMAFPKCKIVHIVRDGRDYVRSGMP